LIGYHQDRDVRTVKSISLKKGGLSMGQKFCTACGAALSDGLKFCENCGSPVISDTPAQAFQPAVPVGQTSDTLPVTSPPKRRKGITPVTIISVIFFLLVIAAGVYFFVLPKLSDTGASQGILPGYVTTAETILPIVTASLPSSSATTSVPIQKPDPFPDALRLKERFTFGSGNVASEATVYKYWINDTYMWHNDRDNRYYVERPGTGKKFLFVFVNLQNNGNTRVWFPPAGNVIVYNNGATYTEDKSHYKPDEAADEEAAPVQVKEVQYFPKLNGDEYAEDFGFSHGTELAYLYPGASNAVDGYIVYEVPQSLAPEETYVAISFNAQDRGVWKMDS
jgi:hypothetical protein